MQLVSSRTPTVSRDIRLNMTRQPTEATSPDQVIVSTQHANSRLARSRADIIRLVCDLIRRSSVATSRLRERVIENYARSAPDR